MRPALLAFLLALASPAAADPATCAWTRLSPSDAYEGPCEVTWTERGARVTFEERRIDLRERRRQGRWSDMTLNGVPAMRFEADRTRYHHATADLNEVLDIELQ